ncbi:haloacid dehalogenase-like hydrolase [Kitasatospora sp. RB6PN24]|uniref:haloacid dehalogenase-like hydrolase n=1 Tax=Kitasatospora humi TaxID=2893891 RepID=UPI001E48AA77|nr:haloacid dehalogenase-like hydrolase [Kitasatospora humi]MCC9305892.1 haloacid dehalogenase-like hydrolase [Kitasatospora humi]
MKRLLVLWDIDGTLIDDGGRCQAIYPRAFERLTGTPARHRVATAGRTEPDIMAELFARHGAEPVEPGRVTAELVTQLRRLAPELRAAGRVLPGAVEALRALGRQPAAAQSVLTGNLRANAALKLRLFGLAGYLDPGIGAYGDDARERAALVPVARRRAAAAHGHEFDADGTVLIGDTPRDVWAARVGGARVIAVASGASSTAVLREAGADAVLADLRDTTALLHAVQALRPAARSAG